MQRPAAEDVRITKTVTWAFVTSGPFGFTGPSQTERKLFGIGLAGLVEC
jgi:hypothetical protein